MKDSVIYYPSARSGIRPMKPHELADALHDSEPTTPASAYHPNHDNAVRPQAKPQPDPTVPAEWYNPFDCNP